MGTDPPAAAAQAGPSAVAPSGRSPCRRHGPFVVIVLVPVGYSFGRRPLIALPDLSNEGPFLAARISAAEARAIVEYFAGSGMLDQGGIPVPGESPLG